MSERFKSWIFLTLALVFVSFYVAVLTGILLPRTDVTIVSRVEPIVFIIIGYFLARDPMAKAQVTRE